MHPLERVRQVASYLLAALLVLNAGLLVFYGLRVLNAGGHGSEAGQALGGALLMLCAAWFFRWFGQGAGR